MKRIFVISVILSLTVLLSGCKYSDTAIIEYYSDIEDYEEIWNLSGFRHGYGEGEMFFPADLNNYDVVDYYCRYDQQLPLGEGTQVYLEIQFPDENSMQAEIDRFSELAIRCDEYFEESGFEAYATYLNDTFGSCEYALVDQRNMKIYFIYVQCLPKGEIEFSHTLLPSGYTDYGAVPDTDLYRTWDDAMWRQWLQRGLGDGLSEP